ncbi:conjugal transfer protein [Metabacillus idriensis]|uniref:CD3337/EF1877 family mobilome membrane protein n=1 Tax=Metabacillus idriensis TaxID=324768 RepID=UPI00203C4ADE|nr:conjugal transfer protein [Metabacillus idriensis]MCM3598010.1 conjugal transfer protein [Metabacillus idriensis]
MKKLIKFFVLSISLLLVLQVQASAASLQDNLVPQDTEERSIGEVDLEYNEFPQHHYKLDTWVDSDGDWMPWNWADGAGKQIYIALMEIINSIWNVNILLANFTMKIVQEAFELDFVSNITEEIGTAIQNIAGFGPGGFAGDGLWPLLVTFVIAIVGAWATYVGMVKRESSRAWGGLISSMIIFVFALGFFSNAPTILKGINDWSSDLQSDVLAVSASVVNPGASYSKEEGIATIRNQMFDLMVKKPYLLMQYGTTEVEEERVNDMLSLDPYSDGEGRNEKAKEEVERQKNTMMSIDGISQRAGFVPLLFVANTIIGIFLLMVSGTIILYQMVFLALVLFAPVPLLMALVPRWKNAAFDWGMKVLHAQLMKISIALLLTILFGISAILYRATESSDLGYLGMMLLQIICFVGVWAKRKELFNIVSTAVNNVESSTGATLQSYRQKFSQARSIARNAKSNMDTSNSKGRIRNQPLTERMPLGQRKIGVLTKEQLAERQQQLKSSKEGLLNKKDAVAAGVNGVVMADRNNQEIQSGMEDYRKLKSPSGVESASSDREQLMDRTQGSQPETPKGNITSIEDLRRRRLESGSLANAPLADRQSLLDARNEIAASLERPETRDAEVSERNQSERNVNLMNQHSHEDKIHDQQRNRLAERRVLDRQADKEVSEDTTSRERLVQTNNERKINDKVNRQSVNHEGHERNINETENRNQINNENNNRTVNHVTDRNNVETETHQRSQENITISETFSQEATHRNEQHVNNSENIENNIKRGKHITQWEAQQQINARNRNRDKGQEE